MTRRPSWLRRQPPPDHSHSQPSLVYRHLIYSLTLTQKQWLLTHCCAQNAFLQPCCQSCGEREQQIGYQLTNTTRASEGSQETKHWWGKPLFVNNGLEGGLPLQCFVCSEPSDTSEYYHSIEIFWQVVYKCNSQIIDLQKLFLRF